MKLCPWLPTRRWIITAQINLASVRELALRCCWVPHNLYSCADNGVKSAECKSIFFTLQCVFRSLILLTSYQLWNQLTLTDNLATWLDSSCDEVKLVIQLRGAAETDNSLQNHQRDERCLWHYTFSSDTLLLCKYWSAFPLEGANDNQIIRRLVPHVSIWLFNPYKKSLRNLMHMN